MGAPLHKLKAGAVVGAIQEQVSRDDYRRVAGGACALGVKILFRHDVVRIREQLESLCFSGEVTGVKSCRRIGVFVSRSSTSPADDAEHHLRILFTNRTLIDWALVKR